MFIELKIKAKSLAVESKIIRKEELKLKQQIAWTAKHQGNTGSLPYTRNSLYRHRKDVVGVEARATELARAFLRGVPYKSVERDAKTTPALDRVIAMIKKYGPEKARYEYNRELRKTVETTESKKYFEDLVNEWYFKT